MFDLLKSATLWLAAGVEAAAALVIGLAAIEAFLGALLLFVPHRETIGEPDACARFSGWFWARPTMPASKPSSGHGRR